MLPTELTDVGLFASTGRYGDLSVHAVIDLRRSFGRAELEGAVARTIEDFPVLGHRYEAGFWRDRWVPVEAPVSDAVHVEGEVADLEAETDGWTRRRLVASRSRQLRLVSLPRASGSRLIVSLTHIAVDGGGMAAVGHVLGCHLYGVAPSAPRDAHRSLAHALAGLRWFHAPVLARDVLATLATPAQIAAAAKRERPYPLARAAPARARHLVLSAAALDELKRSCLSRGASVNDLLVAALARISAARSRGGAVVVTYTMDLRRYRPRPSLTAANTSSMLPVIVPRAATANLADATAAVAAMTRRHRSGLFGPAMVLAPLALGAGLTPHGLVRRMASALHPVLVELPISRGLMVTNVGRIDDGLLAFGEDIEAVRVFGPTIEGVRVPSVVAFGFRGRLHLELFAPPGVAPEALDEFEDELRRALELPPDLELRDAPPSPRGDGREHDRAGERREGVL